MHVHLTTLAVSVATLVTSVANAQVVFEAVNDNGFFTPFTPLNAETVIYGDSGWVGSGSDDPVALGSITLGLAFFNSTGAGSTDIVLTINDGDPSGLVFGTGAQLYTVTLRNIPLPETGADTALFGSLTIPLPSVMTMGGFNDVGWSVALENYNYDGNVGFQVSSCAGQLVGFYTNNASFNDGTGWSLFSFGSGCSGVANYVATIELAAPETCTGDLNDDGLVDGADLGILLGQWGSRGSADFDGSGSVDGADLGTLLGAWGPC
ncbi:MAG: hypothetical protein JNM94_06415 [Phycisphaerae bacterium]|nr:hypothetical protein [Phycisphaerae bacterium]